MAIRKTPIRFFFACILTVILISCSPDPRKEAQAVQIREQAEQDALNQEQQRAHAEQLQQIYVQQQQAIAQETIAAWKRSIKYISIFATIAICLALIPLAVSFSYASFRLAMATARRADVRANLIQLDPATRQFPL